MFDYFKVFYDNWLALCGPGEQPLALLMVQYSPGHEQLGQPRDGVHFDPLNGLQVDRWERGLERFMGGDTLYAPGGGGRALELRREASGMPHLLLTNQRLVVVHGQPSRPEEMRATWWCPLAEIATMRVSPRFLQAGRIFVGFVDGSAIRLMGGMVSARKARRFADAFHSTTR